MLNVQILKIYVDKIVFHRQYRNVIPIENIFWNEELYEIINEACFEKTGSNLYIVKDFDVKPFLNLCENIFDKFGIDIYENINMVHMLNTYIEIFQFDKIDINFHFLDELDKLKVMTIVSLFSFSNFILFDFNVFNEVYVNQILNILMNKNLFLDKCFIILKKQTTLLY